MPQAVRREAQISELQVVQGCMEVGEELRVGEAEQGLVLASTGLKAYSGMPNPMMARQIERHCGVVLACLGARSELLGVQDQQRVLQDAHAFA